MSRNLLQKIIYSSLRITRQLLILQLPKGIITVLLRCMLVVWMIRIVPNLKVEDYIPIPPIILTT